jgi:hypothetical protein
MVLVDDGTTRAYSVDLASGIAEHQRLDEKRRGLCIDR